MANPNLKDRWAKFKTIGSARRARGEEDELKEGGPLTLILLTVVAAVGGGLLLFLTAAYLFHPAMDDAEAWPRIAASIKLVAVAGAAAGAIYAWYFWFTYPRDRSDAAPGPSAKPPRARTDFEFPALEVPSAEPPPDLPSPRAEAAPQAPPPVSKPPDVPGPRAPRPQPPDASRRRGAAPHSYRK